MLAASPLAGITGTTASNVPKVEEADVPVNFNFERKLK
jgi:hypothetical protein